MTDRQEAVYTIAQWWRELSDPRDPKRRGASRAAMANLRRARTSLDALMEPATLDLARRLHRTKPCLLERVGIVAAVLAHVREQDVIGAARACGPVTADDDDGKLKQGRFRRLLQANDDELIDQFRRLVHLLGRRVNVGDLGASILFWGDRIRTQWIFDYYRLDRPTGGPSAPAAGQDAHSLSTEQTTP